MHAICCISVFCTCSMLSYFFTPFYKQPYCALSAPPPPPPIKRPKQTKMIFFLFYLAGYVFAYNTQLYFTQIGQTPEQIGKYLSWIPLVGGSFSVLLGGFISDRLVRRLGLYSRILVIGVSLVSYITVRYTTWTDGLRFIFICFNYHFWCIKNMELQGVLWIMILTRYLSCKYLPGKQHLVWKHENLELQGVSWTLILTQYLILQLSSW